MVSNTQLNMYSKTQEKRNAHILRNNLLLVVYKNQTLKIISLFFALLLTTTSVKTQQLDIPPFGTDTSFETMTWNIEWFPKNGQITVDYVTEIILDLEIDVVALQEIDDKTYFDELLANLEGWEGYYVESKYSNLAYVYNTEFIQLIDFYEIYTTEEYWRPFPRAPMVFELSFLNQKFILINNHLKCCGDAILDPTDPWDEETRRRDASVLLEDYIRNYHDGENVIMLGDLNDILTDSPANNVFNVFLDDDENYRFPDMSIAEGSSYSWSYPSWPSHIDHLLITNELFDELQNGESDIQTLRLDDFFDGGFNEYDANVSDHRPVALKLKTENSTDLVDKRNTEVAMVNFPNPFKESTTFHFTNAIGETHIEIYNINGFLVDSFVLEENQLSIKWNASHLPKGIYFARVFSNKRLAGIHKLVLLN